MSQQETAEQKESKPTQPSVPLTDSKFIYRNSSQTNVQETWKRFGWQPKEQTNEHQR